MVTKENIETTPDITDTIDAVTKKVTVSSDETVNKVAAPVKKSRKTKQIIQHGQAHIFASFNNTIISITDGKGNVLSWASGGSVGFKGARESTPYAAQVVAQDAISKARTLHSLESVDVFVKGIGIGREQAIRGLLAGGVDLKAIFDVTPVPHNGCRKKKIRKL